MGGGGEGDSAGRRCQAAFRRTVAQPERSAAVPPTVYSLPQDCCTQAPTQPCLPQVSEAGGASRQPPPQRSTAPHGAALSNSHLVAAERAREGAGKPLATEAVGCRRMTQRVNFVLSKTCAPQWPPTGCTQARWQPLSLCTDLGGFGLGGGGLGGGGLGGGGLGGGGLGGGGLGGGDGAAGGRVGKLRSCPQRVRRGTAAPPGWRPAGKEICTRQQRQRPFACACSTQPLLPLTWARPQAGEISHVALLPLVLQGAGVLGRVGPAEVRVAWHQLAAGRAQCGAAAGALSAQGRELQPASTPTPGPSPTRLPLPRAWLAAWPAPAAPSLRPPGPHPQAHAVAAPASRPQPLQARPAHAILSLGKESRCAHSWGNPPLRLLLLRLSTRSSGKPPWPHSGTSIPTSLLRLRSLRMSRRGGRVGWRGMRMTPGPAGLTHNWQDALLACLHIYTHSTPGTQSQSVLPRHHTAPSPPRPLPVHTHCTQLTAGSGPSARSNSWAAGLRGPDPPASCTPQVHGSDKCQPGSQDAPHSAPGVQPGRHAHRTGHHPSGCGAASSTQQARAGLASAARPPPHSQLRERRPLHRGLRRRPRARPDPLGHRRLLHHCAGHPHPAGLQRLRVAQLLAAIPARQDVAVLGLPPHQHGLPPQQQLLCKRDWMGRWVAEAGCVGVFQVGWGAGTPAGQLQMPRATPAQYGGRSIFQRGVASLPPIPSRGTHCQW